MSAQIAPQPSWLAGLNSGERDGDLVPELHACCAALSWIADVLAGRPYESDAALFSASDAAIDRLDERGLEQALATHPRIGERPAGADGEWSRQEQAGVSTAADAVREKIAAANVEYEQRFGHVYLVCATGRSADELLAICLSRLDNDPAAERGVVLGELAKITRIRLGRLLHPDVTP